MQRTIQSILLVASGGALGSIARYGVSIISLQLPYQLPIGTFTANIIGCFLIGIISQITISTTSITPAMRLFLMAGFCGGFTTFSTFVFEIVTLIDSNNAFQALLYTCLSVFVGLIALFLGIWIIKILY